MLPQIPIINHPLNILSDSSSPSALNVQNIPYPIIKNISEIPLIIESHLFSYGLFKAKTTNNTKFHIDIVTN